MDGFDPRLQMQPAALPVDPVSRCDRKQRPQISSRQQQVRAPGHPKQRVFQDPQKHVGAGLCSGCIQRRYTQRLDQLGPDPGCQRLAELRHTQTGLAFKTLELPAGSGPERMHTIGLLLRMAIEGTLQLMAVRASTKYELRAAVTMIQQRNNNPLKFAPDAASGIEQLVQPPARGFLDGPDALEQAMHDLVGHSIGTVAGMRAAIEGMLGRFDPAALEAKLSGGSMLDSLLPMNRRARLWDLYLQHHHAIREEAQEDFHNLFGKAFLAAYEQQIERLRLEKQRR